MRVDRPLVLALDVGGTKTTVAVVRGLPEDDLATLERAARFPTPRDPGAFLEAVADAATTLLPKGGRPRAIGIGVPGPLDAERGVVRSSPNLGWRDLPLAALVSGRFGGLAVSIEDDANTGALGEAFAGAGRGNDPFAYLPLGTGLGAGIIIDGRVVRGARGAAGEIGHMAVSERVGPRCACGRRNCVEAWCAGAGLARRAREVWPSGRLADGSPAPRDAAGVFALARLGDERAIALVARARRALAHGMAAVLAAVDPAAMTVGGTIGATQPAFVRAAFREATSLVHRDLGQGPGRVRTSARLLPPLLGDASVLAGAAVLAVRAAGADRS